MLKINLSSKSQKVLPYPYFSSAWTAIYDFELSYVIVSHYVQYMIMFRIQPEFQLCFLKCNF